MRKLLLACTAIALLPLVGQAHATSLTVSVSADGGPVTTFTGADLLSVAGAAVGFAILMWRKKKLTFSLMP